MINDETQGDAVLFDDLEHSPLPGTIHKLIYLAKTKGGTISRVQNGIIVASRCSAPTMQNMHIEKGYIETRRRPEERRVGKECVSQYRSGWAPSHSQTNQYQ